MGKLILNLSEFVQKVYKIEGFENCYFDFENFFFDHIDFETTDNEVEELRAKLGDKLSNYSDDFFEEVLIFAKNYAYERSYIDDFNKHALGLLEEKIISDFDNLNNFFRLDDEYISGDLEVRNDLQVEEVDFVNNRLVLVGDISNLECYIINCINGYGLFYYEDLEDFKYTCGDNQKDRIESHLHWLAHLESIYGTIYGFFQFEIQDVDDRGIFGDTEYTDEEIELALVNLASAS